MTRSTARFLFIASIASMAFSTLFGAVPAGYYYFAQNKKKAELKTALAATCSPMKVLDYGSGQGFTWEGFFYTDRRASDSTVIDMYSNIVRKQPGFNAVAGMHIEHSFPKSWWGAYENNAYRDLFHLYPADGVTNSTKNNLPLGEVTGVAGFDNGVSKIGTNGFGTAYSDGCFEPADEYKGDFARSYLYISTIYESLAPLMKSPMTYTNVAYPFWKPWALELLLKWHRQDPVSPKEQARLETIYNIQGNRNPFIDYPGLVDYIWGADTTRIYPFPQETEPFLLTPRRGTTVDFGVILQNDNRSQKVRFQGVNLTSTLQFSFIRNNPSLSLSSTVATKENALNGFDLTITFAPSAPGLVRDTLVIQGGGLTSMLKVPVKALASADFITVEPKDVTPVGGTLQWISDPLAVDYKLNVYQGDKEAGDLIISSYVDGSSWNKALELFNGTGRTIDLSHYSLQKQSNGAGYFGSTYRLSGTLENNKGYVLVHKSCTTADLIAKAQVIVDSILSFNGNDAVALLHSGVMIDMVGKADSGASVIWGDKLTLHRKAAVTHPVSVFNPSEWDVLPNDSYSNLGSHRMEYATSNNYVLRDFLTGKTTSYVISSLMPQGVYTYSIQAIRNGSTMSALNTMQIHTAGLDAPEISGPDNIGSSGFTANWGVSPYATGYLLDVFQVTGNPDTTGVESFDNVGTTGKPLPTGWTGTASGNYTTTTSAGITPPSIALKNNGEWLQTKTYPSPVSKFRYMYRFPSAATGSYFIVEALADNVWTKVDSIAYNGSTSKFYPTNTFAQSRKVTAFRFTYHKSSGNLSIDDVQATYGSLDTVYVKKGFPVNTNQADISGLTPNERYYYRARAILGISASPLSESMKVQTLLTNQLQDWINPTAYISSGHRMIYIGGLPGNESIQVFSLTGICTYQGKSHTSRTDIPVTMPGVYIVKIQDAGHQLVRKVIVR